MAVLLPYTKQRFFDGNGNPLAGGTLHTYIAGTLDPLETFTDSKGDTANENPIVLDANGEADVWVSSDPLKIVLRSSEGALIRTVDNITPSILTERQQQALDALSGPADTPFVENHFITDRDARLLPLTWVRALRGDPRFPEPTRENFIINRASLISALTETQALRFSLPISFAGVADVDTTEYVLPGQPTVKDDSGAIIQGDIANQSYDLDDSLVGGAANDPSGSYAEKGFKFKLPGFYQINLNMLGGWDYPVAIGYGEKVSEGDFRFLKEAYVDPSDDDYSYHERIVPFLLNVSQDDVDQETTIYPLIGRPNQRDPNAPATGPISGVTGTFQILRLSGGIDKWVSDSTVDPSDDVTPLTGEEIARLYEGLANTNKFTDAEKAKLDGITGDGGGGPATSITGDLVRDALETLKLKNRLHADAIQGLLMTGTIFTKFDTTQPYTYVEGEDKYFIHQNNFYVLQSSYIALSGFNLTNFLPFKSFPVFTTLDQTVISVKTVINAESTLDAEGYIFWLEKGIVRAKKDGVDTVYTLDIEGIRYFNVHRYDSFSSSLIEICFLKEGDTNGIYRATISFVNQSIITVGGDTPIYSYSGAGEVLKNATFKGDNSYIFTSDGKLVFINSEGTETLILDNVAGFTQHRRHAANNVLYFTVWSGNTVYYGSVTAGTASAASSLTSYVAQGTVTKAYWGTYLVDTDFYYSTSGNTVPVANVTSFVHQATNAVILVGDKIFTTFTDALVTAINDGTAVPTATIPGTTQLINGSSSYLLKGSQIFERTSETLATALSEATVTLTRTVIATAENTLNSFSNLLPTQVVNNTIRLETIEAEVAQDIATLKSEVDAEVATLKSEVDAEVASLKELEIQSFVHASVESSTQTTNASSYYTIVYQTIHENTRNDSFVDGVFTCDRAGVYAVVLDTFDSDGYTPTGDEPTRHVSVSKIDASGIHTSGGFASHSGIRTSRFDSSFLFRLEKGQGFIIQYQNGLDEGRSISHEVRIAEVSTEGIIANAMAGAAQSIGDIIAGFEAQPEADKLDASAIKNLPNGVNRDEVVAVHILDFPYKKGAIVTYDDSNNNDENSISYQCLANHTSTTNPIDQLYQINANTSSNAWIKISTSPEALLVVKSDTAENTAAIATLQEPLNLPAYGWTINDEWYAPETPTLEAAIYRQYTKAGKANVVIVHYQVGSDAEYVVTNAGDISGDATYQAVVRALVYGNFDSVKGDL